MVTSRLAPRPVLLLATLLALSVGMHGGPAPAQSRGAAAPSAATAPIDRNGVLILIRSTLIALDQANQTGNYTVLRDLGSPAFGGANSAARLGDIFAPLRAAHMDLSGVAVLDPQLTLLPEVEAGGQLHMTGFFPSVPLQINFDMAFAPTGGKWRVSSLSVSLASATPAPAPSSPAPTAAKGPASTSRPGEGRAARDRAR